ncbi:MAG: TetR/AcrR family transcriptional regulator [Bacillus sp. (in: firmicutes)]
MPKIVNHEKKRKVIAEATWRIISEQGMEGATVRNIAEEAGLSLGALQHYFSSQAGLLSYAMDLVIERVTTRINTVAANDLPPKQMVVEILLQAIPTDKETMLEMKVWFEFVMYARNKPELHKVQGDEILRNIKAFLERLGRLGLLRADLDVAVEADKLYTLVDGMALHAMLKPDIWHKDRIVAVLMNHVDYLFAEGK